jgi:hypothetical protein
MQDEPTDIAHNTEGNTAPAVKRRGRPKGKQGKSSAKGIDGLTAQQRAFVAARTSGADRANAYRMAYDKPHYDGAMASANGALVERSSAVSATLERVKREMEAGTVWDARRIRTWVHSQLLLEATTATSDSARVKALELLGKDAGMFAGKDDAPVPVNASELRDRIRARLLTLQENVVPDIGLAAQDGAQGDSVHGETDETAPTAPSQPGERKDRGTPP